MGRMLVSRRRNTNPSVPQIRLGEAAWNASAPSATLTQQSRTNAPIPSIPHSRRGEDGSILTQGAIAGWVIADEDAEVHNAAHVGSERPNHLCKG